MSQQIIMGLTTADFGCSLLNTAGYAAVVFGGAAAAYLTSFIFKRTVNSTLLALITGAAAGIAVAYFAVKYSPHIVLPDEKALKFLVMFALSLFAILKSRASRHLPYPIKPLLIGAGCIILLTSVGGMFAHIGRPQLYFLGFFGGIGAVAAAAMGTEYGGSSSNNSRLETRHQPSPSGSRPADSSRSRFAPPYEHY